VAAPDVVRVIIKETNSVLRVQTPSATLGAAGVSSVNGQVGIVQIDYVDVGASPVSHGHGVGSISGLQAALDAKAPLDHAHSISDVTGLQGSLDGKANLVHNHEIEEINGLDTALAAIPDGALLVHLAGTETITGTKTFTAAPLYGADPIGGNELTRKSWVDAKFAALINGAPGVLDTLKEISDALGADPNFSTTIINLLNGKAATVHTHAIADVVGLQSALDGKANISALATVAFSGSYNDLTSKPTFATVASTGQYNDLLGKPALFDGTWGSLTGKPTFALVATTGVYNDLTGKPTLFDGTWGSLTGKPTFATVATSGLYADLLSKPTLGTASPLDVPPSGDASSVQVVKGSDSRLTDARKAKSVVTLGGIATLAQKTYAARLPIDQAYTINSISVACATNASASPINFQIIRTPSGGSAANMGSAMALSAGALVQSFTGLGLTGSANDVIQIAVTSSVGGTPPTNVTVTINWTVG